MEIGVMPAEVKTTLKGYYTLPEAAKELQYRTTSNLAGLCREGKIPDAVKLGNYWLLPTEWVLDKKTQEWTTGGRGQARK